MFRRWMRKRPATAGTTRCYETTVSFHFVRNAEGFLIAVDNATGKQIGEIVSMGDLVGENRHFNTPAWS